MKCRKHAPCDGLLGGWRWRLLLLVLLDLQSRQQFFGNNPDLPVLEGRRGGWRGIFVFVGKDEHRPVFFELLRIWQLIVSAYRQHPRLFTGCDSGCWSFHRRIRFYTGSFDLRGRHPRDGPGDQLHGFRRRHAIHGQQTASANKPPTAGREMHERTDARATIRRMASILVAGNLTHVWILAPYLAH